MTTAIPRRFDIAAPPNPMAWIAEALNGAFRCPSEPAAALDRLMERLIRPR
jgi:hypothetical protein